MIECQSILQEICGQGKTKELLAQGVAYRKQYERDAEKENLERRRLVPYHMHIDLDLLECCHLTSAMLLEMANLATSDSKASHHDDRHHNQDDVISKTFRRYLDTYERAVFTGPPENIRDHIMAAAVALREGDWSTSVDHILTLPVWDSVPNSLHVKEMLKAKIKAEALRVYLLTFAAYYETVRLDALCQLFALDRPSVRAVLAKLILSKILHASWDEEIVRLHKIIPTNLQALALQFADKTRDFVENNERSLDRLTGGSSEQKKGGGDDGGEKKWKSRDRRGDRGDRDNRGDRGDRGDRGERGERIDRGDRGGGFQDRRRNQGTHLVQRGYRADRSRSGANAGAGAGGGGNQSNW